MNLHNISGSSSTIFYETELFPAGLFRKWHPVHIAVFHNGHCIITGLRSMSQAESIVCELVNYLHRKSLINSIKRF